MKNLFLILSVFFCTQAWADLPSYLSGVNQKVEAKKNIHFTISDWLSQKSTSRAQDQWLMMNRAPNIFELYLQGGQSQYVIKSDDTPALVDDGLSSTLFRVGFFITIFGLEYSSELLEDETYVQRGMFHLRLFGPAYQATNLTLQAGIRNSEYETSDLKFQNTFYGGELVLYIFPILGVRGQYHLLAPASDGSEKLSGTLTEAGAFFELSLFRLSADVFTEDMEIKGATPASWTRAGTRFSLTLFL